MRPLMFSQHRHQEPASGDPLVEIATLLATSYLRLVTALAIAKANVAPSCCQNALDSLAPPREPVAASSPGE